MLDFIERGGIMMYPLLFSSLLAVAIIIERLITLRRKKIIIPEIVSVVEQFNSPDDIELAKNISARYEGPLSNIVSIALENNDLENGEIKELIEDQARQEVGKLQKRLGILETIAAIAPLLGLAGTVLGMIRVFNVIKDQGIGQASALSGGISEALLTTVAGLFIGIPALVFYSYFSRKTESYALEIEKHSNTLFRKLQKLQKIVPAGKTLKAKRPAENLLTEEEILHENRGSS